MARRRRRRSKHRRSNPRKKRHLRRRNPLRGHRRRRRRNPTATQQIYGLGGAPFAAPPAKADASVFARAKPRRRKGRKLSAAARKRRRTSKSMLKRVQSMRKRARRYPAKSIGRSTWMTQARRLSTLRRVARKGRSVKKSAVYKAMHLKMNPGLSGVIASAKVLVPQAGVGLVGLLVAAAAGKKLSDMIVLDSTGAPRASVPAKLVPYVPAIATVGVTALAFIAADKVAPKYKGAIALGGLIGAAIQALVAFSKASTDPASFQGKLVTSLGLGDYTTVGGRAYADGGVFRDIGDYTTVGDAYNTKRPRPSMDNNSEWATNGLGDAYSTKRPRPSLDNNSEWATNGVGGLDDTTEFAAGEGGVLSGGMFRGPSTR